MPSIGSTQHACGCCAKYEALHCSAVCKPIAVHHAQLANNPLPVAGGVHPQIVENTRSECPQKIICQHLYAEFCHMLIAGCSQSACTQTAAQVLARCGRAACGLYRRQHVNCAQTSADRAAGCGAETGAAVGCLLTRRASSVRLWGPTDPALCMIAPWTRQ